MIPNLTDHSQTNLKPKLETKSKTVGANIEKTSLQVFIKLNFYGDTKLMGFKEKIGDILSGEVISIDNDNIIVSIQHLENPPNPTGDHMLVNNPHESKLEGVLPKCEQIPGEEIKGKGKIKAIVLEVRKNNEDRILLSRSSKGFVKKLFELEMRKKDSTHSTIKMSGVKIVSIERNPGISTKIICKSTNPKVNAKDFCTHMRNKIAEELPMERIEVSPQIKEQPDATDPSVVDNPPNDAVQDNNTKLTHEEELQQNEVPEEIPANPVNAESKTEEKPIKELADINNNLGIMCKNAGIFTIVGEISNLTKSELYFTLKYKSAIRKAELPKHIANKVTFKLKNGQEVSVRAKLTECKGNLKLIISDIKKLKDIGPEQAAHEALEKKLRKAGCFEESRKKKLPDLIHNIGLVTSNESEAFDDIHNKLDTQHVLFYQANVQGEYSAEKIADGIEYLNAKKQVDVIIISRGGGSTEDLSPFDTEIVVSAICASKIPVISAIGHARTRTFSDLAADKYTQTPEGAANLILELKKDFQCKLKIKEALLEAYNPKKTLARGYSMTMKNGEILTSSEQVELDDEIKTRLADGGIVSKVTNKCPVDGGQLPITTDQQGKTTFNEVLPPLVDKLNFVDFMEQIEKAIEELENGGLDMKSAMTKYETGRTALGKCHEILNSCKKKCKILLVNEPPDENGRLKRYNFQ
ncbi:MAG: exodeoxyribonuclease VII large subunit [Planctomycetes bacterium]|nr:exodeoxyribonuclease VII large subunit [Planctomycetota bacterium]